MLDKLHQTLGSFHTTNQYSYPPTDATIDEAYWLGVMRVLHLLREECIAYPIGGIATAALTEHDITAIIKRIQAENKREN